MTEHEILSVLFTLKSMAQADLQATASGVGRRAGLPSTRVAEVLLHLERKGLVDAGAARLTLRGLAIAQALEAASRPGSRAA